MNRKSIWMVVGLFCSLLCNLASAAPLPDRIDVGGTPLMLNGSGARTKYLMQLYVGGLYLTEPNRNAAAILAADQPMAIRLQITSGLVSQEKLVASINEGFQNSTGGRTAAIESQINAFRQCFADQINKGDVFEIAYLPGHGVIVVKNGQPKGVIPGLEFKQAVFGIWLSDNPADADLRVAMLQGR
jgi:hypothetical protein